MELMPKFRAILTLEVDIEADDIDAALDKLEFEYPYNDVDNIYEIKSE
jgi:hypothetical protein